MVRTDTYTYTHALLPPAWGLGPPMGVGALLDEDVTASLPPLPPPPPKPTTYTDRHTHRAALLAAYGPNGPLLAAYGPYDGPLLTA